MNEEKSHAKTQSRKGKTISNKKHKKDEPQINADGTQI